MDYIDENYEFCRKLLLSDEYVLWEGRPEKGNAFSGRDMALLPFSLIWLAFSLFWEFTVISSGAPIMFGLFGAPFVLIGIYMLFGKSLSGPRLRKKTFYVITNKRIIIKRGDRIEIYEKEDIPPMNIKMHKNGNATIYFCDDMYTRNGRSRYIYISLDNISDVTGAQNALATLMDSED